MMSQFVVLCRMVVHAVLERLYRVVVSPAPTLVRPHKRHPVVRQRQSHGVDLLVGIGSQDVNYLRDVLHLAVKGEKESRTLIPATG